MNKIAVIGVGYVGLVTSTCFAELGNQVVGVDIDQKKIANLQKNIIPIFEEGLTELVKQNQQASKLSFTTDVKKAVKSSDIIFIAVGTPSLPDGSVDLSYVKSASESIGKTINSYKVIINKSTVPVGTGNVVKNIIKQFYKGDFDVVSNPEFLREGSAVYDFMNPDRIVIGSDSKKASDIVNKLYSSQDSPIVNTDVKTAEMIKYASNAFLATQISFINSVANICEKIGADVNDVAKGMKLDPRIGQKAFLSAGVGYGGSCFPKDVKGLIQIAHENRVRFDILDAVEDTNLAQKQSLLPKIQTLIGKDLNNQKITVWGLAFKPKTDDVREAPSQVIIKQLIDRGAKVTAVDPIAIDNFKQIFDGQINYETDLFKSVKDADCLVIVTEWSQFQNVDLTKVKQLLNKPNIVDGRNIFNPAKMKELGFNYISVGR
ncbi:MAG TPA: UDP-glucose/GDP-mannose dehydrogenase family protein [Candidatus Woesebacteria bacterium]|jgi:UDPglucose 6-dehydrogenase|nr:UDP-glucose/GDP-mannose dehydrogenase family protein [Candidatus Shapirobacteria bacterium]HOR01652.1 UDP-glucose/GDP-mannose dehydrogenase family protein [Candidatus Woesebacteria bacterium]